MKNPKPAGGKGSSHKGFSAKSSSAAGGSGGGGRKSRWESSNRPPSGGGAPSDSKPPEKDVAEPSAPPQQPQTPTAPSVPIAAIPPASRLLSSAVPPPPQPYGFHNLERRTVVLADGTVRSYFALPPDYPLEPHGDKILRPGLGHGYDPHFPPSGPAFGAEGFREPPPPSFARGGSDYWSSLGLDGPAGSSSLKRKYAEEEFAWQRQLALQYGHSNPMGLPLGPIGDGFGRMGSPSRREHQDDFRLSKQVKLEGEGYDDLSGRRFRPDGSTHLVAREVDKQALNDAFLRLSKTINESPTQRKRYLEDGKHGLLQCVVCGRGSKEFADVHGLIMHAYNSQNAELQIDHLGLHKALCVLMGWDYAKAPDGSKVYQSLPEDDAISNREDLMIWPPVVIIHNTSSGKKKDGRLDGFGNKDMDVKLKELGFGGGKAKSLYGKEGHMGITAVRFEKNEAGLKEAVNLAEFFERNNRGRSGWARVQASRSAGDDDKNPDLVMVDKQTGEKRRIFYGYLATAMDIEKVEFDIRKKVVIKSRRDLDFTK
ncbi:Protein suppresor of gene silencing 3 [Apostasia shenzhenica]|uniref:Protein suppresor of gene silencing 3 n=1 Tax=Apostasia shenzhenica TaxID=1088818 RepID=A0A2I0ARV4_9ASPA|nr:Protein suppresor of gene silencing 3 [Apostasia shenzhenica]